MKFKTRVAYGKHKQNGNILITTINGLINPEKILELIGANIT